MNACYVTLHNGVTLLVKPTYRLGQLMYCYYWFNNVWLAAALDMNTIATMRDIKLHLPTMSVYNDSVDELYRANITNGFTDIPNTYRADASGGSDLFTNNTSGIKPMTSPKGGLLGTPDGSGTVVAPVFPKIDPNWFYTGFPTKLTVGGSKGNLIQYIPIYFYATKDGNEKFTLPKLPDRLGYFDANNSFTETLVWDGPFKKGNLLFTILMDKSAPACVDSQVNDTSYWNLLTEFSNIDPGSSATKSISITSGITKTESTSISLAVGSKISVEAGIEGIVKIAAELSLQLSTSFGTSVSISQQITTTDTVEFIAQPKTQRISTYQFIKQYKINPADPLKQKVDSFNDSTKNYVANFAKAEFEPRPFDYGSRYFAKAFVLEP